MGLFNRKKKVTPEKNTESEFYQDIGQLFMRDDVQCRQDICEIEYQKALGLLEIPITEEKMERAYHLMGNLASHFEYIPAIMWMGDFMENVVENLEQAVFWYKKAADLNDGNGVRCYADMLITGRGVSRNPQEAFEYYFKAANAGVPEALFVIGEYYRNNGERENALKAYQAAVDGGYQPAQIRIDQMLSR